MRSRILTLCAVAAAAGSTLTVPAQAAGTTAAFPARTAAAATRFDVVNLVSDVKGKAPVTDPKVVNPWGMAMGKTLWVSNTGTGTATVYSGAGRKERTEVAIPGGAPTGQVFNPGRGFTVKGLPATFIFASPSGAITGWNAQADPANAIIAAFTRGADYKGLELVQGDDGDFLLATDFAHGRVHAFDQDFRRVRLAPWQFRDQAVPSGYHAYNVAAFGGSVWISYALRDPATGKPVFGAGKGFVSRFTPGGKLTGRVSKVGLNAPWAMVAAPRAFGPLAGALLVGNFGDGTIHAYKGDRHLGALRGADGRAISVPGLWDLEPGTARNGGANALWFSAGIDGAKHGLIGLIRPAGAAAPRQPAPSSTATAPPTRAPGGGY
ncbi:TIGR03118 family protein [Nonomuraea pusilla]|uniref:TIGR03118 family protein n=1 Tax=Nonomuraea pusilla TaxID=46177 RepID=A0A1H7M4U3_9ACTN|nr:TIGR03118 family protein [Nonomuraea pusilla]SEL05607.1 TIGR03118 family protein [Nonomuraea pusilla]